MSLVTQRANKNKLNFINVPYSISESLNSRIRDAQYLSANKHIINSGNIDRLMQIIQNDIFCRNYVSSDKPGLIVTAFATNIDPKLTAWALEQLNILRDPHISEMFLSNSSIDHNWKNSVLIELSSIRQLTYPIIEHEIANAIAIIHANIQLHRILMANDSIDIIANLESQYEDILQVFALYRENKNFPEFIFNMTGSASILNDYSSSILNKSNFDTFSEKQRNRFISLSKNCQMLEKYMANYNESGIIDQLILSNNAFGAADIIISNENPYELIKSLHSRFVFRNTESSGSVIKLWVSFVDCLIDVSRKRSQYEFSNYVKLLR